MAKDEVKKEKKARRKSEAASSTAGDESVMSIDPVVTDDEKKKKKKEKKEKSEDVEMDAHQDDAVKKGEVNPEAITAIAHPLAEKKLSKKVFKTIKKASKNRGHVKRGVKEVVKGLRKGDKGLVILAGDISPMDILSHIPVLCEDTGNPYVFVTSKDALGTASSTKRPTSVVMIVPGGSKKGSGQTPGDASKEDYADEYKAVYGEIESLGEKLVLGQ